MKFFKTISSKCPHCYPYPSHHTQNWINELLESLFHPILNLFIPNKLFLINNNIIHKIFIALKIISCEKKFELEKINSKSALFIEVAIKKGITIMPMKGPFGYTGSFRMHIGNKSYYFEVLPRGEQFENSKSVIIDDKWAVKKELIKLGFPVMPGKSFWWFTKKTVFAYAKQIGYPVIVKPRRGSLSQHVYKVNNDSELSYAIQNVIRYSPAYLVEKFISNCALYRITIVDDQIFVVKRLPPKIVGDGRSTFKELLNKAGFPKQNLDMAILQETGLAMDSVIPDNNIVFLHHKILLALNSEIEEVPFKDIHADNIFIFKTIANHFKLKFVGIDLLAKDIRNPLKHDNDAILELNSMPNIHMHTFIKNGAKQNKIAEALVDLVLHFYH